MQNKPKDRARVGDWMLLRYRVEGEANQWELPAEAQEGLLIETRNLPRRSQGGAGRFFVALAEDES